MKVTAIKCPKCKDIIWSRATHDFHYCTCGNVAIDGGRDYTRVIGDITTESFELEVLCTDQEAYHDWNHGEDKFGLIKEQKDK